MLHDVRRLQAPARADRKRTCARRPGTISDKKIGFGMLGLYCTLTTPSRRIIWQTQEILTPWQQNSSAGKAYNPYNLDIKTGIENIPYLTAFFLKNITETPPASYKVKGQLRGTYEWNSSVEFAPVLNSKHLCKCKKGDDYFDTNKDNYLQRLVGFMAYQPL